MAEQEIELGISQPENPNKPANATPMTQPKVDISDKVGKLTTAEQLLSEIVGMGEDTFIPWEEVTLPSRGEYYHDKLPGGIVRVRAMGIHAEKILATQRLASTGQSIDYLFNHCVQLTDGFDQQELLTGDRIFLLYVLRGITHGNIYEFALKCPNCEVTSTHTYDLNELAQTIRYPKGELGPEPFKVCLPYLTEVAKKPLWVKVRFMRGKDVSQMANRMRFQKRLKNSTGPTPRGQIVIDQTVTENLQLIVESFGGDGVEGEVKDRIKIKQLIEKLHSRDSATIRQFLKENAPGIDTTIQVECPDCANEIRTELPITESFFRPTGAGTTGGAGE